MVETAKQFADRLLDIHLKNVTEATAKGKCSRLGHGVIDIPAFFRTLLAINYTGVASFEYEIEENDPLPGLTESVAYARQVLATI